MRQRATSSRVDLQVSIMTACLVTLSCLLVFGIHYALTYRDMISGLQDRVTAIYDYLEDQLDKEAILAISTPADERSAAYQEMHDLLDGVKHASGVKYLYTAKPLADGSFIYVVDGLPMDSADFRHPGDLIEPEITSDLRTALESSEVVLPNQILETSWGNIFVSYLPIHGDDGVVGVLGVEFDAEHQYQTYRFLMFGTPLIILLFCLIASGISVLLFRRISNPHYRDLCNTDLLTGIKNRNAFETDLNNLDSKKRADICLFSIDLDDLKRVNDTLGHLTGDQYITTGVTLLQSVLPEHCTLYRTGGDEFTIIARSWDEQIQETVLRELDRVLQHANETLPFHTSLSIGSARYDPTQDRSLFDTFRRADEDMYEHKRQHKKNQEK